MKRLLLGLALLALLAAHVIYWYLPRERSEVPNLAAAPARFEPLQVLTAGAYDVCVWIPYPHQNLGALAAAVGDLPGVVEAAIRLSGGAAAADPGSPSSSPSASDSAGQGERVQEPRELPTFGPFEVPPASELVACADLAGGRRRVVARIYPTLAAVAKLAGRLADNPWLAGGDADRVHIGWNGRLWTVIAGPEMPGAASTLTEPRPHLPDSLAVVRWNGARPELPAGYYAMTREGSDLALSRVGSVAARADLPAGAAPAAAPPLLLGPPGAALPEAAPGGTNHGVAPLPALLVAVGPDWHGGRLPGLGRQASGLPGSPTPPTEPASLPPAALAMFETGSSRLSSLGDLPGLAVFNVAGPPRSERWSLPTAGVLRLLTGRLPAADRDGWHIVALDTGSLRQAEALAPGLAALVPPAPTASEVSMPGAATPEAGPPGAATSLSFGLWLDPRASLRVVTRIRHFVESFPLASRHQVELWRDWQTVIDPFANCARATLTATTSPPAMRLLLQGCAAAGGR